MHLVTPKITQLMNAVHKYIPVILMLFMVACGSLNDPGVLVPLTVEDDPEIPAMTVRGTQLRVETFGDPSSPMVVFLHGGPGGDYEYLRRMERLADQYFVVLYDQRGAGLSKRLDAGAIEFEDHLADLAALADGLAGNDAEFYVVGHSWGGQLASAFLEEHADRVSKLVLLDPGPLTDVRFAEMEIFDIDLSARGLNDTFWQEASMSADGHERMDYFWSLAMKDVFDGYHMSEADPMPFVRAGAQSWRDIMAEANGDGGFDFRAGPRAYTGDVLFVRGTRNEVHNAAYFEVAQADFEQATVYRVDIDAGHDQIWSAADATADAIRQFLQQ